MTSPSTRRLSEVARHVVIPSGIVSTGWPAVEAKIVEFGDELDRWQSDLGRIVLGKRADGMYAATVGGVTLSIPRQVAKTWFVIRLVVILCILFPNTRVLWTAHHGRTATQTFQSMQGYVSRKAVKAYITDIRRANGEQEIHFGNGSVVMFGARAQGFGRGFTEIDVEVFDEAQSLTDRAIDDMVAATNQSRHPHGALLFYMGTPPRTGIDPGEVFTARRTEALEFKGGADAEGFTPAVEGEDAIYVECSADPGADPDDHDQWRKANPSFPHRTPVVSMRRLRKNLRTVESWMREALGVWDVEESHSPINLGLWMALGDAEFDPKTLSHVRLALDAPRDRRSATFSMAGIRPDGLRHVQVRRHIPWIERDDDRPLRERVIDIASKLCELHDCDLIMPPDSYASAWLADLEANGVVVEVFKSTDFKRACGDIESAIAQATVRHRPNVEMNNAVEGLVSRNIAGHDVWDARNSKVNIAPFMAATCALARVPQESAKPIRVSMVIGG